MKQQQSQWVGIDVSKATLDVYLRPSAEQIQVLNQVIGIAELVKRLQGFEIYQVIVESTGGLELEVVQALVAVLPSTAAIRYDGLERPQKGR